MAFGDSAGILFKIKGDASDAVRAFNQVERESAQLQATTGSTGSALASLAGPAAVAAAVVAAVGTAAIAVTSKLFELSKSTAEYGSAIFDATQKTGLGAETMSALKLAAEQSGSSFEGVTKSVSKFNVLLGNAAAGNEKAEKTLKQYGITAKDTQGALEQAITAIAGMSNSSDQAAAAAALFKDRTGQILPVIKSFDGNLPGLMNKLRDMGLLMSDKDAKAADEFGDQMDTLNAQFASIGRQLGFAVMPTFLKFANSLSTWLVENKGTVAAWAEAIGTAFSTVAKWLVQIYDDSRRAFAAYQALALVLAHPVTGAGEAQALIQGTEARIQADIASRNAPTASQVSSGSPGNQSNDDDTQEKANKEKANKVNTIEIGQARTTAKEVADIALAAQRDRLQREYDLWDAQQKTILARIKADLAVGFVTEKEYIDALRRYEDEALKGKLANLQLEQQKRKEFGLNTREIDNQIAIVKEGIDRAAEERREADAIKERKFRDERRDFWAEELKHLEEVSAKLDEEREKQRLEDERKKAEAEEAARQSVLNQTVGSGQAISAIGQLQDYFAGEGNTAAIAGLEALTGAFQGLGQAVGQVVQAWVLYGSAGASVRQVTAQILAGIAQQAAIKAVFELAEGFAALALAYFGVPNAGPSATAHFVAAAIYGSIAGAAAIAGRVVAGDSFKKHTATGSSPSRSSSHSTSGQGQAYSGYGNDPKVIEQGRNRPQEVVLRIDDRSDWFGQMFDLEVQKNGRVRNTIRTVAAEG